VLFDFDEKPVPPKTRDYLDDCGEALLGLGYEPQSCVALPEPMPDVVAIGQLWIHPERKDAALVSAIFGTNPGVASPMQTYYTEILSRFTSEDVAVIQTNNAQMVSSFPDLPNELTFRFPMVTSLNTLDRLHQKLVKQHAPPAKKIVSLTDEFRGDMTKYVRAVLVESYRKQEGTGYLRYNADRNFWQPTVKGAYLMTWGQLWPMSAILKSRIKSRATQLLRELGHGEE
jgi:hypothetical protein